MGTLALDRVAQHLDDGFKLAGKAWGQVEDESASESPLLKRRHVKERHYA